MVSGERIRGVFRAPRLAFDALLRGRYGFVYDRMPMVASGMALPKRLNLVRSGANLVYRRLTPWSMPLHLQIELTNYCSLRCPVCPTGSGALKRPAQAMDVELFGRVMREVGPYLLTATLWAWGEPLLHPELREILRIAAQYPVVTLLSTNGQQLNDQRVLDALAEAPPHYLILAMDGLTDETNSVYRVGARLADALEGIRRLAEIKRREGRRRPVLNIRYIVMKHNRDEVLRLEKFAQSHGFDSLAIRRLYTIDSTTPQDVRTRLSADAGSQPRSRFVCQHAFWFPTVLADGTLVLCEQDYNAEFGVGRISAGVSFRDLWYSRRAAQVRRAIRDARTTVSFCEKCIYSDLETSDCNLEARSVGGDASTDELLSIGNAGSG
jgi:radical SAM protein with 4Fe4S-binding SPASM domain